MRSVRKPGTLAKPLSSVGWMQTVVSLHHTRKSHALENERWMPAIPLPSFRRLLVSAARAGRGESHRPLPSELSHCESLGTMVDLQQSMCVGGVGERGGMKPFNKNISTLKHVVGTGVHYAGATVRRLMLAMSVTGGLIFRIA